MSDYIKVISSHCSDSGYCVSFKVDERNKTVRKILLEVAGRIPDVGVGHMIACDRFYNSIDNLRDVYQATGYFMYATIRVDRGVKYSHIHNGTLKDGEYKFEYACVPIPLTVICLRVSDDKGSWFIRSIHDGEPDTVVRRCHGQPTAEKTAPILSRIYNENMGSCDQ